MELKAETLSSEKVILKSVKHKFHIFACLQSNTHNERHTDFVILDGLFFGEFTFLVSTSEEILNETCSFIDVFRFADDQ